MSEKAKTIGDKGEQAVCEYLKQKGYHIVDRNFHIRGGEVDIIAVQDNTYVFCEVKTRKTNRYAPSEAVDFHKRERIIKTAETYLYQKQLYAVDVRFDVAEVVYEPCCRINYIENAFWK